MMGTSMFAQPVTEVDITNGVETTNIYGTLYSVFFPAMLLSEGKQETPLPDCCLFDSNPRLIPALQCTVHANQS